jgi:hypothetical protein
MTSLHKNFEGELDVVKNEKIEKKPFSPILDDSLFDLRE